MLGATYLEGRAMLLLGYVRISQVRGREGAAFIAPELQRERIQSWATREGHEVVWLPPELDVSGRTMRRPVLQDALRRIAAREVDGLVTADRSRFARTLIGALTAIRDIQAAGGVFVSADGFSTNTPEGELAVNVMLAFAQFEIQRIGATYRRAAQMALADGVHVAKVPLGYRRPTKRTPLQVDPDTAPLVRQAFEMRADGRPWIEIQRVVGMADSGTRRLIRNRVYLGIARGGGQVKANAHPALVAEELWQRAQPGQPVPRGDLQLSPAICIGLATCAGCGRKLNFARGSARGGPSYICKMEHAGVRCPAPAGVRVDRLDKWAENMLQDAVLEGRPSVVAVLQGTDEYDRAQAALTDARAELEAYVVGAAALDAALFRAGLDARQAAVERARRALAEVPTAEEWWTGDETLRSFASFDVLDRRTQLRRFIRQVEVRRVGRGHRVPVGDRVTVTWR